MLSSLSLTTHSLPFPLSFLLPSTGTFPFPPPSSPDSQASLACGLQILSSRFVDTFVVSYPSNSVPGSIRASFDLPLLLPFHAPFRHFDSLSLPIITTYYKREILHLSDRYCANLASDLGNEYDETGSDIKLVSADGGMDVTLRNIVAVV